MSREDFMRRLEALLTDVSEEEKQEALSYYRSYFEDAGEENEERILKELESPEKVAATIKADLGMEPDQEAGAYTERGFADERFENKQSVDLKKPAQNQQESRSAYDENRSLKIILLVVIAVLTSPVWGSALAGILGGVFGCAIAVVAATGALYITGGVLIGIGIGQLVIGSAAVGFGLAGAGMMILAVAVLLTIFCVWICGKVIPWICNVIGRVWRSLFGGKEQVV